MPRHFSTVRSLWTLTILCVLREKPLHPYEISQTVMQRRKGDFLDLKRGSLYNAIRQLLKQGMIQEKETIREGKRPEKTVFQITEEGQQELIDHLSQLLHRVDGNSTNFYAALSYIGHLTPASAAKLLELRAGELKKKIAALKDQLQTVSKFLDRVLLLESEYAMLSIQSELKWVTALSEEIRTKRLTWSFAQLSKPPRLPKEQG